MKQSDYLLLEYIYYITPDGVLYPIFGGRRSILSWTAFGMPRINHLIDKGPFQDGVTVRDYRLEQRVISLRPYERGIKRQDHWDNIGNLTDHVRPNRAAAGVPGQILVITPDNTEREIDAFLLEGPAGDFDLQGSLMGPDMLENLRFLCPFPVWRDPTASTSTFTLVVEDSCIGRNALPETGVCIPFCVGSGVISTTQDITYVGTWESFPTIVITGPLDVVTIENVTTSETIKLNYNIAAGETVTITLSPEVDTIVNNFGTNLIGVVENPNDLATFHIEVAPIATGGINTIRVVGSNAVAGATAVSITYNTNYLGVVK